MFEPALIEIAPGVWQSSDPVRIVGMSLTASMAVVVLPGRELLLYSPVAMTPARRDALAALGTVTDLYAPNTFHHLSIAPWADAYPNAIVHAPPGLRRKRPELRVDRTHDQPLPSRLSAVFDEVRIEGFALEEAVLVHRPTRTMLVADLVHNVGRPNGWWARTYTRAAGFYDRVALSRVIRWTAFHDRGAARASLDRLLALEVDRVLVGHGAPIERDASEKLREAYKWLRPGRPRPFALVPRRGGCG